MSEVQRYKLMAEYGGTCLWELPSGVGVELDKLKTTPDLEKRIDEWVDFFGEHGEAIEDGSVSLRDCLNLEGVNITRELQILNQDYEILYHPY